MHSGVYHVNPVWFEASVDNVSYRSKRAAERPTTRGIRRNTTRGDTEKQRGNTPHTRHATNARAEETHRHTRRGTRLNNARDNARANKRTSARE